MSKSEKKYGFLCYNRYEAQLKVSLCKARHISNKFYYKMTAFSLISIRVSLTLSDRQVSSTIMRVSTTVFVVFVATVLLMQFVDAKHVCEPGKINKKEDFETQHTLQILLYFHFCFGSYTTTLLIWRNHAVRISEPKSMSSISNNQQLYEYCKIEVQICKSSRLWPRVSLLPGKRVRWRRNHSGSRLPVPYINEILLLRLCVSRFLHSFKFPWFMF